MGLAHPETEARKGKNIQIELQNQLSLHRSIIWVEPFEEVSFAGIIVVVKNIDLICIVGPSGRSWNNSQFRLRRFF